MPDQPPTKPGIFSFLRRSKSEIVLPPWEIARNQEVAAGMAVLKQRRRDERNVRRMRFALNLWPAGAGLLLAVFVPAVKDIAAATGPWAVTLVFPFAVLAQRPELQAGPITHELPTIMFYMQFPIEGLLASFILRPSVRLTSVAIQLLLFHFLGIIEVLLLNGWHIS